MLHQETLHQEKRGRKGNRPKVTAVNDPLQIDYRLYVFCITLKHCSKTKTE